MRLLLLGCAHHIPKRGLKSAEERSGQAIKERTGIWKRESLQ